MLDAMLDTSTLKAFTNLFVLSIPTSMFYRMIRCDAVCVAVSALV